jgi:hypothetical protein
MEIVMQTLDHPHEPIQNLRPDLTPAVVALVDRCMEKKPQRRFGDATELLKFLRLCREILEAGSERQSEAVRAIRAGLKEEPKRNVPDPALQDMTLEAQSVFRQKALAQNMLSAAATPTAVSQRKLIASVLLALFLGAGLTVGLLGVGSTPAQTHADQPEGAPPIIPSAKETQAAVDTAAQDFSALQRQQDQAIQTPEGAFAADYQQKLTRSLDRALNMAEKHKVVAPILPVSSLDSGESPSPSRIPHLVFSFLMSVVGMVYLAYSRGSKNLTFGVSGALLVMYGWFVPWLAVLIIVGGLLITVPLYSKLA